MIKKTDQNMPVFKKKFEHFNKIGPTPKDYIMEKVLADMMLADEGLQGGEKVACGTANLQHAHRPV